MCECILSSAGEKKHLPCDLDYIPDELKLQASIELFEDEETRNRSLKELREMLAKEEDLFWQDEDLFLLAFLRVRKFDVNRAFSLIKGLYTCFGKRNQILCRLPFDSFRRLMQENIMYFLPYRDHDGCVVFYFRYCAWDPDYCNAKAVTSNFFFGLLQALRSPATQIAGFKIIMDFKGFTLKHLLNTTPSIVSFIAEILQNSVPMRLKGIHFVNENFGSRWFWKIIKPFLSKKLQERVHIQGTNMKNLHEFIHPCILPADLGGKQPPFDNTDWMQRMVASADYIEHIRSFGYRHLLGKN